jgi:hypothetical protein
MTVRVYGSSYLPLSGGTLTGALTIVGNLVATNVQGTNNVNTTGGGAFFWTSKSALTSASDGMIMLSNNAQTDFNRLQFGGTTSSFPALKRSATALETKLADDSAYAQHNQLIAALVDGITAPSATVGLAKIFVDTADGDLKVIFGDGTTKTLATDT